MTDKQPKTAAGFRVKKAEWLEQAAGNLRTCTPSKDAQTEGMAR